MKPWPVQRVCVACHGLVTSLKPEVAEKIKARYPDGGGFDAWPATGKPVAKPETPSFE